MYKLLDFKNNSNSLKLEKVKAIAKLIKIKYISKEERSNLKKQAKKIIDKMINEELVFNPK
jgi:Asp-tRNA(Asn)/Glu-tRNA(Gln) amidotransferase C subunit